VSPESLLSESLVSESLRSESASFPAFSGKQATVTNTIGTKQPNKLVVLDAWAIGGAAAGMDGK
jgi:hypothetical protein